MRNIWDVPTLTSTDIIESPIINAALAFSPPSPAINAHKGNRHGGLITAPPSNTYCRFVMQ